MKLCLEATWEDFMKAIESVDGVILFGASSCGELFKNQIKELINVKFIVDNDVRKYDRGGVYSPEKLRNLDKEILVITSQYYDEIIEQLKELNFKGTVYSFSDEYLSAFKANKERLKQLMNDARSKEVIDMIYQKRVQKSLDYADIMEENEYFNKDFFEINPDAVFIDGGAYNGDTIKKFIQFQKNRFKKIYAFELDIENYSKIDSAQFDNRVRLFNYGLWNEETEISFMSSETGSSIADIGNKIAKCVALDDIIKEKVTFIKMDIEGAELKALIGAENIIKEYKPQLAICIYHKPEDIYEIPFWLHDKVPEYKFYIRHHSKFLYDTVLYAVDV